MKHIYLTEEALVVEETKQESTDAKVWLGTYSKQKLINLIEEFPELKHPLPVYEFLSPEKVIHKVIDIAQFARDNNLISSRLHELMFKTSSREHRGWKFLKD